MGLTRFVLTIVTAALLANPFTSEYHTAVAFGEVVTINISAVKAAKATLFVNCTLHILVPFPEDEI
jgi:hypothetical protein